MAGYARAIIATSGSANAATGPAGDADQAAIGRAVAAAFDAPTEQVLHLSTGIIGTRLPVDKVEATIARVAAGGLAATDEALASAALSLRTTDSTTKMATVRAVLPAAGGGAPVTVTVSGICKGVGMIHPRMATMLSVVLTDATADPATLRTLLRSAAARTWDQLSVDGDTSTNDTVFLLASGAAGAADATTNAEARAALAAAIEAVARDIACQQARDGEGATALITCQVSGAADDADARAVARAVISSSLVKAAVHGRDANWGRIAGAAGNALVAERAVLEAAGLRRRRGGRTGRPAGRRGPGDDADRHRRTPRVRRGPRWPHRRGQGRGPRVDGRRGGAHPPGSRPWRGHGRSLRLSTHRGIREGELGVHDVSAAAAAGRAGAAPEAWA